MRQLVLAALLVLSASPAITAPKSGKLPTIWSGKRPKAGEAMNWHGSQFTPSNT